MSKRKGWGNIHYEEPEILDPLGLLDDDDNEGERISVHDAAELWRDSGMDEDETYGYTEDELRAALDD